MNKLLILSAEAAEYDRLIRSAGLPELEISTAEDTASAQAHLPHSNIILADPPLLPAVLDMAVKLEWLQSSWAGVDRLCQPGMRRDYVLTGVKGIFGPLISEYVITYLFALERRLFALRDQQREKTWQPLHYRPAKEIRLGIVGLGSIGRHLARSARHFGLRVSGLNRSGRACEDVDKVCTVDNLAAFLEQLDYVVLTLPDTGQTKHFINAGVLRLMKPSAVIINVGRGSIINEDDLAVALREGSIGGAVLDVFEQEPLPSDSPLWQLPNVYVTPHHAATSFPADVSGIFIENYQRFVQQQALLHVVDFELGY